MLAVVKKVGVDMEEVPGEVGMEALDMTVEVTKDMAVPGESDNEDNNWDLNSKVYTGPVLR